MAEMAIPMVRGWGGSSAHMLAQSMVVLKAPVKVTRWVGSYLEPPKGPNLACWSSAVPSGMQLEPNSEPDVATKLDLSSGALWKDNSTAHQKAAWS